MSLIDEPGTEDKRQKQCLVDKLVDSVLNNFNRFVYFCSLKIVEVEIVLFSEFPSSGNICDKCLKYKYRVKI